MNSKWDGVDVSQIIFAKNLEIQELKRENAELRERVEGLEEVMSIIQYWITQDSFDRLNAFQESVADLIDEVLQKQEEGKP